MVLLQITLKKTSLENYEFTVLYDFYRLFRVKEAKERIERSWKIRTIKKEKKLRYPFDIDEKVLDLAERLKKKDAPGNLYKIAMENKQAFNRNRIFTLEKRVLLHEDTIITG